MVDVTYTLSGANGDTIALDGNDYVLNPGMLGFGIPPTSVRISESAGVGGTWRFTKRGVRDVDLPITILGIDRADVEAKLRRLARLTQDTKGPTRLNAIYDDGSSLSLNVHYVGGAEGTWGDSEGLIWCKWVMSFQAPQPYWESQTVQTFFLRSGNTGRGLLPQLSRLAVASSSSLGIVDVNSNADVDVYPVWTITGPITGLYISNGVRSFSFETPVLAGETITVDTEAGTVIDSSGANRYAILSPAPKLFPFEPGESTIEVSGIETSTATQVVCNYALRYEVVH
jgi:hypothetical protein